MTIQMSIGEHGVQCTVTLQHTTEFEALKKVTVHISTGIPLELTEAELQAINQISRNLSRIKYS